MQLSSLELPVAFYGISSFYGNNFLYIKIIHKPFDHADLSVTSERVIIIPDGNYNAADLIDKLNYLVSPKDQDNALLHPLDIFSFIQFTLDITSTGSGTGKVTISPTGAHSCLITEISMDFTKDINGNHDLTEITTKFGWNLGFIKKTYSGHVSHTADSIIEPAAVRYIYLAIDGVLA